MESLETLLTYSVSHQFEMTQRRRRRRRRRLVTTRYAPGYAGHLKIDIDFQKLDVLDNVSKASLNEM